MPKHINFYRDVYKLCKVEWIIRKEEKNIYSTSINFYNYK